jgi:hypothetical protein
MANDVANVKLGVATVTYNSVLLGHTKGGVEISLVTDKREIMVDEYGSTPVGAYTIGQRYEIKTQLAEHTLALLKSLIPDSTLVTGATKNQVDLGKVAGTVITPYELVIHPTAYGTATTHDWTFYKAIVMGDISIAYKTEEETIYEVTFLALIDESKAAGKKIAKIGTSD